MANILSSQDLNSVHQLGMLGNGKDGSEKHTGGERQMQTPLQIGIKSHIMSRFLIGNSTLGHCSGRECLPSSVTHPQGYTGGTDTFLHIPD